MLTATDPDRPCGILKSRVCRTILSPFRISSREYKFWVKKTSLSILGAKISSYLESTKMAVAPTG